MDLVKDINPEGDAFSVFNPFPSAHYQDRLFFVADDGTHGQELWITDGTEAGTYMVKDINPGTGVVAPNDMVVLNGRLFFQADDGEHGRELWVSDATEGGTHLFKDINPGSASAAPNGLFVFNGRLYFSANNGTHGFELWTSDGTEAGTFMLADIRPGGISSNSSPRGFTTYEGKLYFVANDGATGEELWVTDGTEAGTRLLSDIRPGGSSSDSSPNRFIEFNGRLFFIADDGTHGWEWWYTDGTEEGTQLLKDINPGLPGLLSGNFVSPPSPIVYNGKMYFAGMEEVPQYFLYVTDGTTEGTHEFQGPDGTRLAWPQQPTVHDGLLFFGAQEPVHGDELWATDGTPEGTRLIKDIHEGTGSSIPNFFTGYGHVLYFVANEGTNGTELWRTDGTSTGTFKVVPGSATEADPLGWIWNLFRLVNGKLLFPAHYDERGYELFALTDIEAHIGETTPPELRIHPNPFLDVATVEIGPWSPGLRLHVANSTGQLIQMHDRVMSTRIQVDLSGHPAGPYFISLMDGDRRSTVKLMKTGR